MFRNYSFNFGRNVTKCGRNMERRRERDIAKPKFELKSFRPSSLHLVGMLQESFTYRQRVLGNFYLVHKKQSCDPPLAISTAAT